MTVERLGRKLYNWASIIEPKTREQPERTAAMPFIHPRLARRPAAAAGSDRESDSSVGGQLQH